MFASMALSRAAYNAVREVNSDEVGE
jgi:hypothetical protein